MQKLLIELRSFYKTQGRHDLPWRRTRDPYKILVSEIMLQQTQVKRVLPFYAEFMRRFPSVQDLARAPLNEVLKQWSGLGYNRRAKYLHEAAKLMVRAGTLRRGVGLPFISPLRRVPAHACTIDFFESLPGVGPYTARAVATFAYNSPEVFVETNIRTVFIHYCFKNRRALDSLISDKEILPLVEVALKKSRMQPRDFYAALMDYGSYLKQKGIKLNTKSKHYTKQSTFEGSHRQLRGMLLRELLKKPATIDELVARTERKKDAIARALAGLSSEGIITLTRKRFAIV